MEISKFLKMAFLIDALVALVYGLVLIIIPEQHMAFFGYPFEALGYGVSYSDWSITFGDVLVLNHTIFICIITLGLNSAAYQAEYFRGAIGSIGGGQMMAARAIGMSKRDGIRHVILPQSLRRVIPSWSNEAAYLPKYTVVAYYLGVEELFAKAHLIVARTFQALPAYIFIALIFLTLITIVTKGLDVLYDRIKIPGV